MMRKAEMYSDHKIKECSLDNNEFPGWHGTTIIGVKKDGKVVVAGDGQLALDKPLSKGRREKCANYPRRS